MRLVTTRTGSDPVVVAYDNALRTEVRRIFGAALGGRFQAMAVPSGLYYRFVVGPGGDLNQSSFHQIDGRTDLTSNGQLQLTGSSLSTLYARVLQSTTWSISPADQAILDRDAAQAAPHARALEQAWRDEGGPSPARAEARPGGLTGFILHQLQGAARGGPALGRPRALQAAATYQAQAGDSARIQAAAAAGWSRIQAASDASTNPSASNGGLRTDGGSWVPAYTLQPDAPTIADAHETGGQDLVIRGSLDPTAGGGRMLRLGPRARPLPVPGPVLSLRSTLGTTLLQPELDAHSGEQVRFDASYPGATLFHVEPLALAPDNSRGWYATDILQDIARGPDPVRSGFVLQGQAFDRSALFGPGGDFNRVRTWVISRAPTITLRWTRPSTGALPTAGLQPGDPVQVELAGRVHTGRIRSLQLQPSTTRSGSDEIVVVIEPPANDGSVAPADRVAQVLGGVVAESFS